MTATEVTEQLETSETTEINIDMAREVSWGGGILPPWGGHPRGQPPPRPMAPHPDAPPLQAYRPCAQRASVLFFVLNDMGRIDPMYQFSLDAYIGLFILSIDKSHRSNKLEDRIDYLNEYHTYAVYRSAHHTASAWLLPLLPSRIGAVPAAATTPSPLLPSPYTFPRQRVPLGL